MTYSSRVSVGLFGEIELVDGVTAVRSSPSRHADTYVLYKPAPAAADVPTCQSDSDGHQMIGISSRLAQSFRTVCQMSPTNSQARICTSSLTLVCDREPFDAHCCHMSTVMKHPVPDRVKPSFVIFDIRAL